MSTGSSAWKRRFSFRTSLCAGKHVNTHCRNCVLHAAMPQPVRGDNAQYVLDFVTTVTVTLFFTQRARRVVHGFALSRPTGSPEASHVQSVSISYTFSDLAPRYRKTIGPFARARFRFRFGSVCRWRFSALATVRKRLERCRAKRKPGRT